MIPELQSDIPAMSEDSNGKKSKMQGSFLPLLLHFHADTSKDLF